MTEQPPQTVRVSPHDFLLILEQKALRRANRRIAARIERGLCKDPNGTIGNEHPKVAFGGAKKVPCSRKEEVVYRSQAWLQDKNLK
jgi:hypothetical protein